ncbi:hypothetical protein CDAR_616931 [Caerostris darwini]|uniref:Kazal-like domain-containing protein n=1 Tax=Caerostris darwini TaxID=1538125 RepID=A0AAV4S157_9ARAC|nr:hypothetical protein CDAR_616931 [Caerostris darwini]
MTLRKLWLVVSVVGLVESCYKFPENVKDPCEEKECHFGAQCRPSLDGTTGECVCPEKCATYGDSRGSRPVCGNDGHDYPNLCELRRTACRQKKEIEAKFQGPCELNSFSETLRFRERNNPEIFGAARLFICPDICDANIILWRRAIRKRACPKTSISRAVAKKKERGMNNITCTE